MHYYKYVELFDELLWQNYCLDIAKVINSSINAEIVIKSFFYNRKIYRGSKALYRPVSPIRAKTKNVVPQ